MILILTTESGDHSHIPFIDWLRHYDADFEILSGESIFYNRKNVVIKNNQLFVNGRNFSRDVNVVFNRRWLTGELLPVLDKKDPILSNGLKKNIVSELYDFRNSLHELLPNAKWIPSINNLSINKIELLVNAQKEGVLVPPFIITNVKTELVNFKEKYGEIITKAIGNFHKITDSNHFLVNPIYTKIVTDDLLKTIPNHFQLSFFQKYIIKKTEYRVIFFESYCYVVEILSQENDYSIVDSRKTDEKSKEEIRLVESKIPKKIEDKIMNVMSKMNINIGCIDVIEDRTGKFYFLEVNPVGQISGYTRRTGSNFEELVIRNIIKYDKEQKKN